jgi:hypothetical protein
MMRAANETAMNVVRLDDKSMHGDCVSKMLAELNEAHAKGELRGLMVVWLGTDGYFNYAKSSLPSATRAIGALEQMKYNLMAE